MTRVLTSTGPMRKALVLCFALSLAAHGAVLAVARPASALRKAPSALPSQPPPSEDRWTGTTAELPFAGSPAAPVYDVTVETHPPPAPAPAPAPPPILPDSTAPLTPPAVAAPLASAAPPRPRRKPRPAPADRAALASSGDASGAAPGGPAGGSFGAEGPASVRDLGRAFTRAIPPACDADPVWASQPAGDTGKLEVAVHVDAAGHISGAEPRGDHPPRALLSLLRRTLPLLQAGTFAVRGGDLGAGTEILELRAQISDAPAGEDAPGRLAFAYGGGRGKAGFTQASGRHVEVSVRVVGVER